MQQLYEVFDFLAGQFYLWHCLLLEVLHEHGAEDRGPRGEDLTMDVQLVALDQQYNTRHLIDDGEVRAATFHACNDNYKLFPFLLIDLLIYLLTYFSNILFNCYL